MCSPRCKHPVKCFGVIGRPGRHKVSLCTTLDQLRAANEHRETVRGQTGPGCLKMAGAIEQ